MFGFPDQPREDGFKHKKNLLSTAVFQLKYKESKTIRENEEKLEKLLLSRFPIKNDITEGKATLKFEPSKTPILESSSGRKAGVEFKTEDDKKVFKITEEAFTLSIFGREYTNSKDALEEIENYLLPTLGICGIETVNRVSSRKINLMEPSASEGFILAQLLRNAFNDDLICNIMNLPNAGMVKSGVSQISLKIEGYRLNLSYGLLPQPPTGKLNKPQLILDIDLISENSFYIKDIIPEWRKINKEIYNIFSWAINDQLKLSLDL